MKVSFRQSGGFAGLVRGIDLDSSKMDAAQGQQLEKLATASGIQGNTLVRTQAARDQFQYEITIDQNGQISKLSFDDHTVPAAVQPLLSYLKPQARPMPLDSAIR
jgi:hypothetical protein